MGLSWERARALIHMVREGHEIGPGSPACRKHLLKAVSKVVGAPLSIFVADPAFSRRGKGPLLEWTATDFDFMNMPMFTVTLSTGRTFNPLLAGMIERRVGARAPGTMTFSRLDLSSNSLWYRSPYVMEYLKPAGYDDWLASIRDTEVPGLVHGIALVRATGDRPFTDEDRDFVHLFHRECGTLLASGTMGATSRRETLTPRIRLVYDHLLAGAANKDIAQELGISPHTVHEYVKTIFRTFGVHTRAQLLAQSIRL